jgi:molecular chaperone Hsp33
MTGRGQEAHAPAIQADDAVVVFRTLKSGMRGRLVRLGGTLDGILTRHTLPEAASEALGEALALVALLGSAIPASGGKIILQTRTTGAVSLLVADCEASGRLRGYARYDARRLGELAEGGAKLCAGQVLGEGHLAITIDQGDVTERYQSIVALDGAPLSAAACLYFEGREGLPTFLRLAVARHYVNARAGTSGGTDAAQWHWRAGGLMMQSTANPPDGSASDTHEDWTRVRLLSATVEDHELLDPSLPPEALLLRLFHEEGVVVDRVQPLANTCSCSRDKVRSVLASFDEKAVEDMRGDDGRILVTCEFCAAKYTFAIDEIGASAE